VNGEKAHTTQKPEGLLYRVLLASTNPGDVVLDPFFGTGTTGAVAKKLGRYFIGVERDSEYVKIAKERIAAVTPAPTETLTLSERRGGPRVPFGALLEAGLLQPGQILTFVKDESITAVILANGQIQSNAMTGSIHSIAKSLLDGVPVNGWDMWLFKENGHKVAINDLRQKIQSQGNDHETT
jgi:modification methylase